MSSQLKRMTFSIYMDPGALESDRYAVGVLQNWYQRARKIQEGTEEFDFSKSRFHKDIYLSGMFMYVLAPNLCKAIANALGPEQVSMTTLRHAFASCGFNLGEVAGEAQPAADVMIDEIVARLAPQLGQSDTTSLVDEIVSRLGEQQPARCGMNSDRGCLPHWIMTSWPKPSLASCHQQGPSRIWLPLPAVSSCSLANWKSNPG